VGSGSIAFGNIELISHIGSQDKGKNIMRMSPLTLVGIALVVLGIVAFAYHGIPYTSREKIIDVGSLQASVDTRKTVPMSPLLIGLTLAGGAVLVAVGSKKSS
jgi:hypothetical protein